MTGDQESTCGEPRAERLRTSGDGLELRALHELDAFAYHALVRRNAEHLTRFGDYTDEVAATAQQHRRELAERDSVPLRSASCSAGSSSVAPTWLRWLRPRTDWVSGSVRMPSVAGSPPPRCQPCWVTPE